MSNPLPDPEGVDRLRGTKRDKREVPGETRGAPQATFLPPPAPLQPSTFDQYANNGSYPRTAPGLLPTPSNNLNMGNSRTSTNNPNTSFGHAPNNSRYTHSTGYHGMPPMQGYGNGNGNYQPQHSFTSTQYNQQFATMGGASAPPNQLSRGVPLYQPGNVYQPYTSQPSSLRYPAPSNSQVPFPGYNPTDPPSHNPAAPSLVVNEAYLDHLRQKFPLSASHRKEIESLTRLFPQIDHDYYLFDKIGEGTFSSVYKGVDVKHDIYDNTGWDLYPSASDSEGDGDNQLPPPALVWEGDEAGASSRGVMSSDPSALSRSTPFSTQRRGARYKLVAVKKIYVTSSCQRIENEIEILHTLSGHPNIVGLITALRREDQIIVVTPYYRHHDFRETFQAFSYDDMRHYMRCLLKGLSFCHMHHIIHRDVKPSNFLYHLSRRRGQLADFGLAQRQELPSRSSKRIRPMESSMGDADSASNQSDPPARPAPSGIPFSYVDDKGTPGVLRNENRPSIRANRAGTRGFRAPEVLLKVVHQTTSIDIWSAGVILLCMLSRRFPFFNSTSDQDALIEIGIIFGSDRMQEVAHTFDRTFLTNVPSVTPQGMTFEELLEFTNPEEFHDLPYQGIDLLKRLLEPQPDLRITADQSLHHPFLSD